MTDHRWHGIRVARQQRDNSGLITDAVGPFLDEIGPSVPRAYYLQHWRRGPHVRIFIECADRTFDETVLPAAERILGRYLAAHPSRADVHPSEVLELHRQLAAMEDESGPLTPWYPDNTVAAEEFPSRATALGSAAAEDLLRDFYVAATPLALRMTAVSDQRRLFATAFDQLVTAAHVGTPAGLSRGFVAFRSHAEAYLTMAPDGPTLRSRWEQQYRAAGDQFRTRAAHVVATASAQADRSTVLGSWAGLLEDFIAPVDELVRSGGVRLADTDASDGGALAAVTAVSPFHRLLQDQAWWRDGFADASWFKSYRVLLNFGYLHLTRAGITPVQRFLLCYLVSRAAEDLYGVTAAELINRRGTTAMAGESR